jgi:hypothetical protein
LPIPNRMINCRLCSMNLTFRDDLFGSYFPSNPYRVLLLHRIGQLTGRSAAEARRWHPLSGQ